MDEKILVNRLNSVITDCNLLLDAISSGDLDISYLHLVMLRFKVISDKITKDISNYCPECIYQSYEAR